MGTGRARIGGRPTTEEDDVERIQRALRRLRDEKFKGSATELARALQLSQSAVSQLIHGRTTASLGTARRIARLCNVTLGQLLDGDDFEPFPNRALAAQIAKDGGLPAETIERVLAEPVAEDGPVLFWLKKIEAAAILASVKAA